MKYYCEYVNHMLRFFTRYYKRENEVKFKKEVDSKNWEAVKRVLDNLPEKDRNVIIDIYSRKDTLSDNVYEVSKEFGIDQDSIWVIVNKITRKIAKERELI